MSNENPFAANAEQTPQPLPPKSSTSTVLIIVFGGMVLLALPCCVGLLLPAVQAAREAARRMSCSNNMKQIALGLHNYHSVYKALPPAYTVDEQGRPLHSWRTLLLPFIEQEALYKSIDLTKPWDDPVNQTAMQTMVPVYRCPSQQSEDPKMTVYVAVDDPSGMMDGSTVLSFRDTLDGLSNTIMFVETDDSNAVHWMSPQDIDLNTFTNAGGASRSSSHIGGQHICLGDGAVIFVTDSYDSETRRALLTKDGGENIGQALGP